MSSSSTLVTRPVAIQTEAAVIAADLTVPDAARGLVIFAHGSGSSRHSQRNRAVANALAAAGLASLLADLLTEPEARLDAVTAELRFDVGLLGERVVDLVDWAGDHEVVAPLPVGLFGASTGAAAALVAAAERREAVRAVVSRGGRPDLAGPALPLVTAPTLFIVGGRDPVVLELNRQAMAEMSGEHKLQIVPGASHLFEEPGALEVVSRLAIEWYVNHLH